MIPFLTYPLALIGLLAVPTFMAIYLFRNVFRRKQVSSLLLWETLSKPKEGGSRVERLQFPLIFFLELLAILFLIAAAIDMRWPGRSSANLSKKVGKAAILGRHIHARRTAGGAEHDAFAVRRPCRRRHRQTADDGVVLIDSTQGGGIGD